MGEMASCSEAPPHVCEWRVGHTVPIVVLHLQCSRTQTGWGYC